MSTSSAYRARARISRLRSATPLLVRFLMEWSDLGLLPPVPRAGSDALDLDVYHTPPLNDVLSDISWPDRFHRGSRCGVELNPLRPRHDPRSHAKAAGPPRNG